MRNTALTAFMLTALLAGAPALAATAQTDTARLAWQDGVHALSLESSGGIVRVTQAETARFSVRSGDRILRIDGHPVRSVADLTDFLAGNDRSRVPMILLRKGSQLTVTIDAAAWHDVLPPTPPAPPAPPAAPPPPPAPPRA
ncbi:PDZ domain-containing protein [Stenotrophomonas sp.]|uniref:PDZ domain-containing protein n=1 Tax=Stenotrophomonas sp. TaxID=69392 RepID=UPI002FCB48CE